MTEMTRTQEEISTRLQRYREEFLGDLIAAPLLIFAEFDTVKDHLLDGVTKEDWDSRRHGEKDLVAVFTHACDKTYNHRGISAGIGHGRAIIIAWLLVDDAFAEEVENLPYENYGAGALKAVAERLGGEYQAAYNEWNVDGVLDRMAAGQKCTADCIEGCSQ